jgi:Uma2 family endonuclease
MSARTISKPLAPYPYRFTVEKFHEAGLLGLFPQDARLELVEGEIFMMPPIGPDHSSQTRSLLKILVRAAPAGVDVSVAEPVVLSSNTELIPDFSLVKHRADFYRSGHPKAKDTLLVIEVSDTSAKFDKEDKALIYGKAGVLEYWVVDIPGKCLHVFREPGRQGYKSRRVFNAGEKIRCSTIARMELAVSDMLL